MDNKKTCSCASNDPCAIVENAEKQIQDSTIEILKKLCCCGNCKYFFGKLEGLKEGSGCSKIFGPDAQIDIVMAHGSCDLWEWDGIDTQFRHDYV